MAREVRFVTETIGKIMAEWTKNGKKSFIVKVPKSHHIKEFELLLKQMLIHYQVPVKTEVQEIPVEIRCKCGYCGEIKNSDPTEVIRILCPSCKKNHAKVISGKNIEVI
ncbi:MAG: hypothetical protein QMD36_00210 [Candidatus Aenigmarchaeota archaeon]|nr:hypothetical protein [Candidatus Aenigmarchaeota archaeon]